MNYQQQSQLFSAYNNPSEGGEDINWAQLAQRWIQTQHSQQQPYPTQPPPPPPSRLPYSHGVPPSVPLFHGMPPPPPPSRAPGFFPTPLSHVSVGPPQNNWRPLQHWAHPPSNIIGYPSQARASVANHSFFPQGPSARHDEEEYQAHYDPSLEQDDSIDQRPPVPEGAMAHWMATPWNAGMFPPNFMPIIDTQMRKRLPAWILDGLEKAEREKQKKMEKEEFERRRKEREEEKQRQREAKGIGKFEDDSDDGDDADDNEEHANSSNQNAKHPLPVRKFREFITETKCDENEEEIEEVRTDEQRLEEALMIVRRLMTTVLLETTNREFERIAEEVLTKGKAKAQPKILAQSTALAALTSLVGNDEDLSSSEDEEENEPPKKLEVSMGSKQTNDKNEKQAKHGINSAEANGGSEPVVFKVPLAPPQVKRKEEGDQHSLVDKEIQQQKEEEREDKRRKDIKKKSEVGRDHAKGDSEVSGGVALSSSRRHEKETTGRSGHGETTKRRHRGRDEDRERRSDRDRREDREKHSKSDRRREQDLPAQYRLDNRDKGERVVERKRRRSRSRSPTNRRHHSDSSPRH